MAEWAPPAEALVDKSPAWSPPTEAMSAAPSGEPHTTASGVAASLARGAAPIAAGALMGAGIGSVLPGPGTAAGAAAGATAAGFTELAGLAYKPIARHFGYEAPTPSDVTNKAFDAFGVKRPSTGLETAAEFAGGLYPFGVGASSTAKAAGLPEMIHEGRATAAEKWIDTMYSRAVGPRVAGKDTVLQRRSAISDIVENKAGLKYTDPEGAVVASGRLPESLSEWGQAVDQTKLSFFHQWDVMAKLAGSRGAMIDLRPIAQELRSFASDPSLIRNNPTAVTHALEMAERYEKAPLISPVEAQKDLVVLNQNLRRYFRSPSPIEPADNMASRLMRDQMDKTIESYAGPGWQELRNRYTSLRAIEDDVDRGARRVANWRAGGGVTGPGVNVASLIAAGEGVVAQDWRGLALAATTKVGGDAIKRYFHPDAVVKRIFRTAEKYHKPRAGGGGMEPPDVPTMPSGMQPPRPTGPGQDASGGTSKSVASGGQAREAMGIEPGYGIRPKPLTEDFLTIPGGGSAQ